MLFAVVSKAYSLGIRNNAMPMSTENLLKNYSKHGKFIEKVLKASPCISQRTEGDSKYEGLSVVFEFLKLKTK